MPQIGARLPYLATRKVTEQEISTFAKTDGFGSANEDSEGWEHGHVGCSQAPT
jgi:hypothetical protein